FQNDKVQLGVVIDIVGTDDVGMVKGGNGAGLEIEAFQGCRIVGHGEWQYLESDTAAHALVFAQVDAAHAAGAELLQEFVFAADVEAAPLAAEETIGLEASQHAALDKRLCQLL